MPQLPSIIKIYRQGLVLLLAAFGYNFAAVWLGLDTWHSVFLKLNQLGTFEGLKQISAASLLFLVILYPLLLGLTMWGAQLFEQWLDHRQNQTRHSLDDTENSK